MRECVKTGKKSTEAGTVLISSGGFVCAPFADCSAWLVVRGPDDESAVSCYMRP